MAQNYLQPGKTLSLTVAAGAESGQLVKVGSMLCVATVYIPAGGYGACAVCGVWTLPKATGAITEMAKVYMDNAGKITATETGNTLAGVAVQAADAASTTVAVLLNGIPG